LGLKGLVVVVVVVEHPRPFPFRLSKQMKFKIIYLCSVYL
jgi:hypothetical protein